MNKYIFWNIFIIVDASFLDLIKRYYILKDKCYPAKDKVKLTNCIKIVWTYQNSQNNPFFVEIRYFWRVTQRAEIDEAKQNFPI